ncbi:hypothetical protein Syun_009008 [Stephania yunnanensis]|uniref:Pentatricopeptide repeat-containing protein n=1 Tax=Stephania yunnanensis TaxID=152371 RepID=A0AAP0PQ80_9MAGN
MIPTSYTKTLNRFSKFPSVSEWNSKIRSSISQGCTQKALLLFRQMKQSSIEPDKLTFPIIAKASAKLSNLRLSESIHTHVLKSQFMSDVYVQTALVDMYVKCGRVDVARQVFERMPERDVASWNVMIMGFAEFCGAGEVMGLFRQMRVGGFRPDSMTLMALSIASSNSQNLNMVRGVHCIGVQTGIDGDVCVANTWISGYSKCMDLESAQMVFRGIPVVVRTVVSWNSMIAGYAFQGKFVEAFGLYRNMCSDCCNPDLSTMVSLLSSCVRPEALLHGNLIHSHAIQSGFDSDVTLTNTLISFYAKLGDIDSARFLFNGMNERTRVSWTALIGGYAEKGDVDEGFALFLAMEATGEKPDAVTLVAVLSVCGQAGTLELGRWIHEYATSNGLGKNVIVCNALLDMYSKCGSMSEACEVFLSISERTIVTWTTMITGYALNGEFKLALDVFSQMVVLGLRPNHLTFLAVLQACAHAGFVEKGWMLFRMMTEVYKISPILEHYACIADMLGRKGRLKEALEFIQTMPVKPDAGVWGALLGACKTHNDAEIGEYVTYRLLELEPQSAVPYVAMANIYASEGKWDGVAKFRAMMRSKKVRKSPGHSLVQVNGKIHTFTVEDMSHPKGLFIFAVLDSLALQLKEGLEPLLDCGLG